MYQTMNDPYRQPEYVSVETLGSDAIENRVLQTTFSETDLQVPMQLIQQQQQSQQQQLSHLPHQQIQSIRSPNKTRTVRPTPQPKGRPLSQAAQQPLARKQISHVVSKLVCRFLG